MLAPTSAAKIIVLTFMLLSFYVSFGSPILVIVNLKNFRIVLNPTYAVSFLSLKMYGENKFYNFFLCLTTAMSKFCAIWILWLWKNSPEPPIGRPPIHLLIQCSSEALAAPAELLRHPLWICNTISHLQRKLIYPLWPVVNQTSIHFPRLWEPSSRKCVAKQTSQQEPGSRGK